MQPDNTTPARQALFMALLEVTNGQAYEAAASASIAHLAAIVATDRTTPYETIAERLQTVVRAIK